MNEIKKDYKTAMRFAYQCGAEKVANPGHEDCNVFDAQEGFASYAGVGKFADMTRDQKRDFWHEWNRGINDEKKLCGLA